MADAQPGAPAHLHSPAVFLPGASFARWKNMFLLYIASLGLFRFYAGAPAADADAAAQALDARARYLLLSALGPHAQAGVENELTAFAMWTALLAQFQQASNITIAAASEKISTAQQSSDEPALEYVNRITALWRQTFDDNIGMREHTACHYMIRGLSSDFSIFVATISTASWFADMKFPVLRNAICTFEGNRPAPIPGHSALIIQPSTNTPSHKRSPLGTTRVKNAAVVCSNCDGYGHFNDECPSHFLDWSSIQTLTRGNFRGEGGGGGRGGGRDRGRGGGRGRGRPDHAHLAEMALADLPDLALSVCDENDWVWDTGATRNIFGDRALLSDLRALDRPISLRIANGTTITARFQGTGHATTRGGQRITISDVLLIEGQAANLISVPQLLRVDPSLSFDFNSAGVTIMKNASVLCTLPRNPLGACTIPVTFPPADADEIPHTSFAAVSRSTAGQYQDASLWHSRLGHLGYRNLERLVTGDMVEDMPVSAKAFRDSAQKPCTHCIMAKMDTTPFSDQGWDHTPTTTAPLQLVHVDLSGRISPPSLGGAEYFLTITDDFSRYSIIVPIKNKSDVHSVLLTILQRMSTTLGLPVIRL